MPAFERGSFPKGGQCGACRFALEEARHPACDRRRGRHREIGLVVQQEHRVTRVLAAGAAVCAALLAIGEVMQHVFGMQPCSWCVLQRLIFLLVGLCCAVGALAARSGHLRLAAILLADALSAAGLAAALYQQLVASKSASCLMTLADRIVMALSLHEIAPWMFMPTAPCNEANLPLFGLPFALWSAAGFVLIGTGAALALVWTVRARRATA